MRAVVCQHHDLRVEDMPDPEPGEGQVLLEVERCGICGSDLHARTGIDEWAEDSARIGYTRMGRSDQPLVFGHEFSGRVLDYGPGCRKKVRSGAPVAAFPIRRTPAGIDAIGLSQHAPGAYAERVVVQESLMLPVPGGLRADLAAMTEPMAVAWHAVRRSEVAKKDVAIVVGCGPVGLGVILCLKARGVGTVVASDLSPARRALAEACGADVVVDPRESSPYAGGEERGHIVGAEQAFELLLDTREKLERLPVGWWRAWRLGERLGFEPKRPVIFECVGVPGMIAGIIDEAPLLSRVVVVGVCVGADRFRPSMAINKEIDLRFVLGYSPLEFRDTLHMLAGGKIDPTPLVTGEVGLAGVDAAFTALANPEEHAKVLIDPRSDAATPG